VLKDETSRADELLALGWPAEDVRRYSELWEYRQRWGAINLERDDRLFLRKAEAALPKRLSGKAAQKKSLRDKSYVRWLAFHLDAFNGSAAEQGLTDGERGAWAVLLEEELGLLDHYQPVLGLPDTLRSRDLVPLREQLIEQAGASRRLNLDFQAPIQELRSREATIWKPLRGDDNTDTTYPVLSAEAVEPFRRMVRQELGGWMRQNLPSLKGTDKPEPA
jgi:hypothetical protein